MAESISLTAALPPVLQRNVTAEFHPGYREVTLVRTFQGGSVPSLPSTDEVRARLRVTHTSKGKPRLVTALDGGEYGRVVRKQEQAYVERQLIAALRDRGLIPRQPLPQR